jgi:predicted dehydrogenase
MDYRCAIVGCGARAAGHAAAYGRVGRGKLVACCDLDTARLDAFADQHQIPGRYTSLPAMLAQERPDIVHLVTKPIHRVGPMTELAEAGVPAVIVEKPICVGAADYLALRALEQSSPTRFAVNHQLRHHPLILDYLRRVGAGEIGAVRMIDASAGLPLSGQGVHILDLAFAFAGYSPVEKVFAAASGYDDIDGTHPSPAATAAVITFAGGIRAVLQTGEGFPVFEPHDAVWFHKRIAVYGTHGHLHWRMSGWERSEEGGRCVGGPLDYGAEDIQGQAALTEAVFDWIEDARKPAPTNLATSLDEWLAILAIYQSAVDSRAVALPFDPPHDLVARYRELVAHRAEGSNR